MEHIAAIIAKVDTIDIEAQYDQIFKKQPFLLSLLIGYQKDLTIEEFGQINKLILMIWEYFKENQNVKRTKMTQTQFEKAQDRNIHLLKYLQEDSQQLKTIASDLEHLKSKDLLSGLFFQFQSQKILSDMSIEIKAIIMIGMKSIIECFEEIKKR